VQLKDNNKYILCDLTSNICIKLKAQAYEKNMYNVVGIRKKNYDFFFIWVRTTTKSIKFINKPEFCFDFFHVVVLVLLAK
jgi:hypothetical protein